MAKVSSYLLHRCFLFSCVDKQSLPKISKISRLKTYEKNEVIFHEGQPAEGFFILLKGRVKVYKLSPSGGEHILHIVGEGGSFAEATVFGRGSRYPAFAEALCDTEVVYIGKHDFLNLMRSDFSLTLSVLNSLSEKLKYFNTLVEELSLREADARLAKYLLDLSLRRKSDVFLLDMRKHEVARKLGISPETLSRIFKKFKGQGILRLDHNEVHLYDKKRLYVISSGQKA